MVSSNKTKRYVIRNNNFKLKNGRIIKGYRVTLKHPDQRHLITRNFLKKSDAEKWAKLMTKTKSRNK